MKINKIIWGLSVVAALALSGNASAQAGALTVLAVKSALQESIQSLREALAQTTNDLQSLGNSLQANAQNVLLDVDRTLGSKLQYTFDRLDASELRLAEDAQALTRQVRQATQMVVAKAGDEARKTLVEADIAAYNTSYSLPCRDARPRVLASFPARLLAGRDSPKLTVRGNFLRQGGEPEVTVNGTRARIVERLDNALSVEIPQAVMQSAVDDERLISVKVARLEEIKRSLWAWGLLGCHERTAVVDAVPIALSVLEPPVRYALAGTTSLEYTAFREVAEPSQKFENTGSGQCDDNYRVDRQWCVTGPGTLAKANVRVESANCSSSFEGTTPSGDRCILASGKVAGCGAVRGPFNAWLGCKGRGWLVYHVTLVRNEPYQVTSEPTAVSKQGRASELSFAFDMPAYAGMTNPQPRYTLQVDKLKGKRFEESFTVSHANPNAGPVTSRVSGGVLAVEIVNQ